MCPSLLRDCLPPEDWNVAPSLSYAIFIPANAGSCSSPVCARAHEVRVSAIMFKSKKIYTFIHYFNKLTILYPSNLFMIINYFKQITILCPPN